MPRVVVGLVFFPRGGSSHVTRALASALPGWDVTLVSGSRAGAGDARRFFPGLDLRTVDFTAALAAADPMRAEPPMHPSFEDRPGAADRVFAALDEELYEHQVVSWARALGAAGAAEADILYLHHLTPLNEAAARVAPGIPVVAHLHGTELLMLEAIDDGPPAGWDHAAAWVGRMRRWAQAAARVVTQSEGLVERAVRLLGIEPERCFVVPNGYDPQRFAPREVDRAPMWRRHLVLEPQGWRPGEEAGSVAYDEDEVAALAEGPSCSTWAASPRSSASPCSSRPSPVRRSASPHPRRSYSSAATPANGRASTPSRPLSGRAPATSSWPGGTTTTRSRTS